MFQQAKWFGFSLVLHLAVASSLVAVVSRTERTPKTIMVDLADCVPAELPRRETAEAVVRPVSPVGPKEPSRPALPRQTVQPTASLATQAPEHNPSRDVPESSPEVPLAATIRPRVDTSHPVPTAVPKTFVHSAPAAEERPTLEKVQQRYLKEHFTYIRDLITSHLAYPPMARRMRWSGKVVVAFVIAEDGSVHNLRVVDSSGFPILDRGATEAVRNVAPFPKPPVRAEITVPINFRMMQ